jgi:hypothetical protein
MYTVNWMTQMYFMITDNVMRESIGICFCTLIHEIHVQGAKLQLILYK